MTWQHYLRRVVVTILGAIALALASQARAESNLISPQDAERLVRAQLEEQKAAEAALKEEMAAIEAEEAAKAKKSGKTVKGNEKKKAQEAEGAAAEVVKAKAEAPAARTATQEKQEVSDEETASLPVELPTPSRSARADAAKAGALKPLIARYASENGLPYGLADAVVRIESRYNPGARNGPNVGLTQINVRTAQSLGYKGDAAGLMDAETNLRYGLKYLAVAYKLASGDTCGTILRYQFGHRTTTMTSASRAYCARVKVLTAAAD